MMNLHSGSVSLATMQIIPQTPLPVGIQFATQVRTLEQLLPYCSIPGVPPFTQEEYIQMMEIKWAEGIPVINLTNRDLTYEICMFLQYPKIVAVGIPVNPISKKLLPEDYTFKGMCDKMRTYFARLDYKSHSASEAILMSIIYATESIEYDKEKERAKTVKDSIHGEQCIFCGSYRTISDELQTTSGDESTAIRIKCYDCRKIQTKV
jgi:DNA-directed RNA polymerase subunit M/transcription elongation factor TFIIS